MTIEITARNANGFTLAWYTALDAADAVEWMAANSHASFVDGYTVGGFGIVRVSPTRRSFTWLDGEFTSGDAAALTAALHLKVGPRPDNSAAAAAERVRLKRAERVTEA